MAVVAEGRENASALAVEHELSTVRDQEIFTAFLARISSARMSDVVDMLGLGITA